MAFPSVHVVCGYVGAPPAPTLIGDAAWSQSFAAEGVTSSAAPQPNSGPAGAAGSNLAFEVLATVDVWVAIGSSPDASQAVGSKTSARYPVRAGEIRDFACRPGDKLAWVAA